MRRGNKNLTSIARPIQGASLLAVLRRIPALVLPAVCLLLLSPCHAQSRISRAQIEERLRFLTTVDRYSPSAPLSQEALMQLALEQRHWGVFPESYWGKGKRVGADGWITCANVRRFLRDLTGQDLKIWKSAADEIQGDEMRWVYNTSNTMHQRAAVRMNSRKDVGRNRVDVTFQILDYPANSDGSQPMVKVGTGAATLVYKDQIWTVTNWKTNRLQK